MVSSLSRASTLGAGVAFLTVALLLAAPLAAAQELVEDVSELDYAFTVREINDGAFAWDLTSVNVPAGSTVALIYNSDTATAPHNVLVTEGGENVSPTPPVINPQEGKVFTTFVVPEGGTVVYQCQVHPEMEGTVTAGAFTTGGGGDAPGGGHIVEEGVHFLAHWVGVISFAVLFILYGFAFFLFKYNETPATTDHMDRSVAAGDGGAYGEPFLTSKNSVTLLVAFLVVATFVIAYLLRAAYFV